MLYITDICPMSNLSPDIIDTPAVMGIINVNNESFYSGSRCCDISSFSRQFNEMTAAGAGIIDIGACSTRPGSTPITEEQEWQLLEAPLRFLAECKGKRDGQFGIPGFSEGSEISANEVDSSGFVKISIDTFRSEIVRRAYDIIGNFIVNDISAGEDDQQMLPTVGELGLEYIAMHKRGTPDTMQRMCDYPHGVVQEVAEYFLAFEERAAACGISSYIMDPGFGFAKTIGQNYALFMGMPQLKKIVRKKLLVGISRKSMIYKPLGITPDSSLTATAALNLQALMLGADILRVHDVAEALQCIKLHKLLLGKPSEF